MQTQADEMTVTLTVGTLELVRHSSGESWVRDAVTGAQSLALHYTEVAALVAGDIELSDVELSDVDPGDA